MSEQNPLQKLLATPMTRKEFIKHVGIMLLSVIGVAKILDNILKMDHTSKPKQVSSTTRWGGGKFGV
ncbi:MAG: hypothetical protein ABIQ89_04435 [Candidatus Saccharimonadales bacterium]